MNRLVSYQYRTNGTDMKFGGFGVVIAKKATGMAYLPLS